MHRHAHSPFCLKIRKSLLSKMLKERLKMNPEFFGLLLIAISWVRHEAEKITLCSVYCVPNLDGEMLNHLSPCHVVIKLRDGLSWVFKVPFLPRCSIPSTLMRLLSEESKTDIEIWFKKIVVARSGRDSTANVLKVKFIFVRSFFHVLKIV